MKENQRVVLLRVAIDTGCGGMLGPIFDNGSFEFIPIPDRRDCLKRTYENTKGRHGQNLIEYFSGKRPASIRKYPFLHFDPEFKTFTYGDPTKPKQSLKKLESGDLLVFYAGLKGWEGCKTPPGLYIIGYFVVKTAGRNNDLKRAGLLQQFAKNWHILNKDGSDRLILIRGGQGSRLLDKAVRISALKKAMDKGGHPVFVLDPALQRHFGNFTELNAIQRSLPRWVKPKFTKKAAAFVLSLK